MDLRRPCFLHHLCCSGGHAPYIICAGLARGAQPSSWKVHETIKAPSSTGRFSVSPCRGSGSIRSHQKRALTTVPWRPEYPEALIMLGSVDIYNLKASLKVLPLMSPFSPSLPLLPRRGDGKGYSSFFSEADLAISSLPVLMRRLLLQQPGMTSIQTCLGGPLLPKS